MNWKTLIHNYTTTTEDERFVYRGKQPIIDLLELPETEKLQVELTKDANGLGITNRWYVCEKEELSGSAADLNGRIRVNDRIIEVDGQSLQGLPLIGMKLSTVFTEDAMLSALLYRPNL